MSSIKSKKSRLWSLAKKALYILLALGVLSIPTIVSSCAAMGSAPNESDLKRFESSKQFVKEKGVFDNELTGLSDSISQRVSIPGYLWKDMWAKYNSPEGELPEEKPNFQTFMEPSDQVKSVWFGHSTFLLNVKGRVILVDPVFGEEASPVWFMINRYQDPVVPLEELPEVDVIIISHDHYDHLDKETVDFYVDKKAKFLVPLGVGSHLKAWGVSKDRILEHDWWQSTTVDSVEYIATPAQHFSGRGTTQNNTLWASWVIRTPEHKIYFSGDTGYASHFKEIGEKYGPFDVAFLECGQYNEAWKEIHLLPDDVVTAYQELGADFAVPVHWGMFDLSLNTWFEPVEEIRQRELEGKITLATPKIGQIFSIVPSAAEAPVSQDWWKPMMQAQVGK